MSLYGMMRTGGSGMNAQANRLSTVAENIANASTVGYKRTSTEFSSMILPTTSGGYNSGSVDTKIRRSIAEEGSITNSTSGSDLAIKGTGFFVVSGATGTDFLTRAGAFTQDQNGTLVNSAGYKLQGYKFEEGQDPTVVVNGFNGLTDINLAAEGIVARGSTKGFMGANLDSSAAVDSVAKTSMSVLDSQGNSRLLELSYTKVAENKWNVKVVDKESETQLVPAVGATPPDGTPALLSFKPDGTLDTDKSVTSLTLNGALLNAPGSTTMAGTGATMADITIDLTKTTQIGYSFTPTPGQFDGSAPSKVAGFEIDDDGIVYVKYENNKLDPRFRIAMADVQSPDNLVAQSGNVYSAGAESGAVTMGFPGTGQFGSIQSGALEGSNVDLANELTSMIESQRSYTANSKVFQTGADLLDVLVNLKR